MTTLEKLKRNNDWAFCIRRAAGALWATEGHILIRLDGETAEETGRTPAETIEKLLEQYAAELPSSLPARWGSHGRTQLGLTRQVLIGEPEEIRYLQEGYIAMFSGEPRWIGGDLNGIGHSLIGATDAAVVCIIKGTRDSEIAETWEPITNGYDPESEAEYYRNLALYPEEEEERP
jgi:hypothetical protein